MATAIVSAARGVPVRDDVAMTGEITLSGLVLPVGGIREKVLAARRHGIRTVILPQQNEVDLTELPADARKQMEFVPVRTLEDKRSPSRFRCRFPDACRPSFSTFPGTDSVTRPGKSKSSKRSAGSPGRPDRRQDDGACVVVRKNRGRPDTLSQAEVDTGVVQIDSLHLDEQATLERAAMFYATFRSVRRRGRSAARRRTLRRVGRAPAGLRRRCARSRSFGCRRNFTWDWIYEAYDEDRAAGAGATSGKAAYHPRGAGWRLPMHGGFATFQSIIDVPFVPGTRDTTADVRKALGLRLTATRACRRSAGYGAEAIDLRGWTAFRTATILVTVTGPCGSATRVPPARASASGSALYAAGLRYEDLVTPSTSW